MNCEAWVWVLTWAGPCWLPQERVGLRSRTTEASGAVQGLIRPMCEAWGSRLSAKLLPILFPFEMLARGEEETFYNHPAVLRGGTSGKDSACQFRKCKRCGLSPWVGKIPWRTKRQPTIVFLPGESHGQRSLAGYSPWGHKVSDMTETT